MSLSVWLTRVFWPRQKPGTGCPGIWWSHRPRRSLRRDWMWHSVPRSGCHGGAGSQLGLRTSEGFSKLIDSVIRRGKGWCLPRCRARSGHGSSQSSQGPGPADSSRLSPQRELCRGALRRRAPRTAAPAAVGGALGGASRFPPLPLALPARR